MFNAQILPSIDQATAFTEPLPFSMSVSLISALRVSPAEGGEGVGQTVTLTVSSHHQYRWP
jgi:hypothetical protein